MRTTPGGGPSLPRQAVSILKAAVRAADAGRLVARAVRRRGEELTVGSRTFDLAEYENVRVAAFGKASPYMAASLAGILGGRLSGGLVVAPRGSRATTPGFRTLRGGHPLPDENSLRSGREILGLAAAAGPRDLLFCLISGGGSALVCLPVEPVALEEKVQVSRALLKAGASIGELNAVRKHLSAIKGGRLAAAASPARVVNLVVSDVIGNDLETIASGPSHWDSTTYADAIAVLERYGLWKSAPASVRRVLREGAQGLRPETLRRDDRAFRRVSTYIVGDNRLALRAAGLRAEALGWKPVVLTSGDSGEARLAARQYVGRLVRAINVRKSGDRGVCFLAGGELTVNVRGRGRGGRNTEFCLAALLEMDRFRESARRFLIASLGTDGFDGTGRAAGAWITDSTVARVRRLGLDPAAFLEDNDSFAFFRKAGGLIVTGPTRTNVMDIRLFLAGRPAA